MADRFAEIRARFEAEARAKRTPRLASDLPDTYESITTEWLTSVLCKEQPGAHVTSFRLGPPDEGTSSRRRIDQIDYDAAVEEAWRLYRQQLFSALVWWSGTLGQPPEALAMQPSETSRTFIARMATAIDDLDALDGF